MQARLTLMAVHAHPDDEATGTGGVLARYAAEGFRTVLVTCTDGRCGDGPDGVKPGDPDHHPEQVVASRRAELEASCAVLGISDLELLGYPDSGMAGWPQNTAEGSFWSTPVADAADRLARLIDRYRPDVIVTYDENGFYGHPDHIQAHRVTMAAARVSGTAAKLYWTTVPRSAMERFGELIREFGGNQPTDDPADESPESAESAESAQSAGPPIGLPDDEISTWVDVRAFAGQKFDALAAHASQGDNIFFIRLGRDRFADLMGIETFVRVDAFGVPVVPSRREDDLFAGLRTG